MKIIFVFFIYILAFSAFSQDMRPKPCHAKTLYDNMPFPIPGETEIFEVDGHIFRIKDLCTPVYISFDWKNEHKEKGLEYKTNFTHVFSGELWYRDDIQDFVIVGNPNGIKGTDKVTEVSGKGFRCVDSRCSKIQHFQSAKIVQRDVFGTKIHPSNFIWAMDTSYHGEEAPETLRLTAPAIQLAGGEDGYQIRSLDFNNLAIATDFQNKKQEIIELITAQQQRWFSGTIKYDNNADSDDLNDHNKGEIRVDINIGCPQKLQLIYAHNEPKRFVFSSEETARLEILQTAVLDSYPPSLNDWDVDWYVKPKEGTKIEFEYSDGGDSFVRVKFEGLPEYNKDLGPTIIKAKATIPECGEYEASIVYDLYYPRDVYNNPSFHEPNWFHYWSQTSAANGLERGLDFEFVEAENCANKDKKTSHYSETINRNNKDYLRMKRLGKLCDLNAGVLKHQYPLVSTPGVKYDNIDAFAMYLLRSKMAYDFFVENWHSHYGWPSNSIDEPNKYIDKDKDYIPDYLERDLGYEEGAYTNQFQVGTYLYNDVEHYMSKKAEAVWRKGSADSEDWAYPGNQWR